MGASLGWRPLDQDAPNQIVSCVWVPSRILVKGFFGHQEFNLTLQKNSSIFFYTKRRNAVLSERHKWSISIAEKVMFFFHRCLDIFIFSLSLQMSKNFSARPLEGKDLTLKKLVSLLCFSFSQFFFISFFPFSFSFFSLHFSLSLFLSFFFLLFLNENFYKVQPNILWLTHWCTFLCFYFAIIILVIEITFFRQITKDE